MLTPTQCLDDDTPVADLVARNNELSAEVAEFRRRMREIAHLCTSPGFTAAARRNAILEIARKR